MSKIDLDLLPQSLPEGWVPGVGPHFGCMIVGEAPGKTEWEVKRPFVGKAGQFLRQELVNIGLDPDYMYITNVVKVYPPNDGRTASTKTPSEDQIEAGLPYLIQEIQHVVPKHILALGSVAYQTLTGSALQISLYRGMWYRLAEQFDWEEALVLPTYHPAYVMRNLGNTHLLKVWRRDLTEFATAWLKGVPGDYDS